jgi:hypothetical protein
MGYAQDLVSKGYYGYAGWGDAEAQADFNATGGSGKGGQSSPSYSNAASNVQPSSNTQSVLQNAEQIRQYNVQANQPAIANYQASKQPLQDRYKSLLDEMKSTQTTDVNKTTISTNAELAKRGVTGGLAENTINQAVSPINQAYTSRIGQVAAGESLDLNAIDQAIASLSSGNPSESVTTAQNLYNLQQQQTQYDADNAYKQQQLQQQQQQYQETTLPESIYLRNKPYYSPNTSSGGNDPLSLF